MTIAIEVILKSIIALLGIDTVEVIETVKGLLIGSVIPVEALVMFGLKLIVVGIYYLLHEESNVTISKEVEA